MAFPDDWAYKKKITIPASNVTGGDHSSYKAMVRLGDDSDLGSHVSHADGRDIRFSEDGTTVLNYELVADGQFAGLEGCWTWYNGPVAIKIGSVIYLGWTDAEGRIHAASYNTTTRAYVEEYLPVSSIEIDDHDNPAFCACSDGNILLGYTGHNYDENIRFSKTTAAGDITTFPSPTLVSLGTGVEASYSNLERLTGEGSGDGRIYNFSRYDRNSWCYMYSDDDGDTWSTVQVFWESDRQCYSQIYGNGTDRIDFLLTPGHPSNTNYQLYHVYYEDGDFYNSDETQITASLPFDYSDLNSSSLVYTSATDECWNWDIIVENGVPYVLFAVFPNSSTSDHDYYYGYWTGSAWSTVKIADAGTYLYSSEAYYSGGLCFQDGDPETIYFAQEASSIYEMKKMVSDDHFSTKTITSLTSGSTYDNFRPNSVRGGSTADDVYLLFCGSQSYTSYTDFETAIRVYPGLRKQYEFAWVELSSDIGTSDVDVDVYYGNPDATDAQSPTDVWDEYEFVIHGNPDINDVRKLPDSTGNGHYGDLGQIEFGYNPIVFSDYGPCLYLNKLTSDEYIPINGTVTTANAENYTSEQICAYEEIDGNELCLLNNWGTTNRAALFRIEPSNNSLEAYVYRNTATQEGGSFSFTLTEEEFVYISQVFDYDAPSNEDLAVQVDDVRLTYTCSASTTLDDSSHLFYFGNMAILNSDEYKGVFSGLRVGLIARSGDYQSTLYDNIFDQDSFLTVGTEQIVGESTLLPNMFNHYNKNIGT